jgi:hypothetical protein
MGHQPRSGQPVGWARPKPPANCGMLAQCPFPVNFRFISKSIQKGFESSEICINSNKFNKKMKSTLKFEFKDIL